MKTIFRAILMILCLSMLLSCIFTGCTMSEKDPVSTTEGIGTANVGSETESSGQILPDPPEEPDTLIVYPEFDARIERDYFYSVSVTQGEKTATLPVYNHTEVSRTTRNPLDTTADKYRRFSTFSFDPAGGGVRVDVRVHGDFDSYSVIPSAKHFRNEFYKGTISVYLDQPDYFMIRLDGKDSTLIAVFADAPETDVPEAGADTIVVDGWYETEKGLLEMKKPGTTLYIKPGAVLNSRVKITADNCRIIGRGAILDPFSDIYRYDEKNANRDYTLLFISNANNVTVDGVHLLNARAYNVEIQGVWERTYAKNNRITNLKVLSTQMSSDGLMFNYYVKEAYAEHCFVYCGDNALNYEDEAHFKDILVGTTCNAIFPQTDIRNSSLEDIYVFRADDNVINAEYGGSNHQTLVDNSMITNLYVQDITFTNYFLLIENETDRVVSSNGGFTITNVYLPDMKVIKKGFYYNTAPADYQVTLVNLSINGETVGSITPLPNFSGKYETTVKGSKISYPSGHTFTYTTTSGFDPAIPRHSAIINFKNDLNVFIGEYQVNYRDPVVKEGDTIFLPLEQTQEELRTDRTATVTEQNGIRYISADSLVSTSMAKEVRRENNKLVITPVYSGENLILPDEGIISQFTEIRASHMSVTAEKQGDYTVFHVTGNQGNKSDIIGLHYLLNEAVRKYGSGTYCVTFRAKSTGSRKISATIGYGQESNTLQSTVLTVGTGWTDCTLEFSMASNIINQEQVRLTITAAWADVSEFDVKDICLVKTS